MPLSYEQRIIVLQNKIDALQAKIATRDAKVQARKPESLRKKSSFVGPLLPTQSRSRSREEIAQIKREKDLIKQMRRQEREERAMAKLKRQEERREKATARSLAKEALMSARIEAKKLKEAKNTGFGLMAEGNRSRARAYDALERVRAIMNR